MISRMADLLGANLMDTARCKIERNAKKYPAQEVRGKADKR